MYEKVSCTIEGLAPLLMHNGQLANPLNPIVKEIKKITAKGKKKTDADLEELSRLEFMGGLYLGDDGAPVIPGEIIEAVIRNGARKSRRGKDVEAGLISDGNWPLIYDGPKEADSLWEDKRFVDVRGVGVKGNKVMRTRARFASWQLSFELQFLPDMVNREDVREWTETAGRVVGICDYGPKFGRFVLKEFN